MILLVHMFFAAAAGYKIFSLTGSLLIASLAALISHYLLDAIPHVEYISEAEHLGIRVTSKDFNAYLPDAAKVLCDLFIGLFLIYIISPNQPLMYLFAFLGIAPDGATVLNGLTDNKLLKIHQRLHGEKLQHFTRIKKFPASWGILTQVLIMAAGIALLIF